MSVPPKTDQDVPDPHRRTLPHFPVNEQGMRELELWIEQKFGLGKQFTGIFYNKFPQNGPKPRSWVSIRVTGSTGPNSGGAFAVLLDPHLALRVLRASDSSTLMDVEEDAATTFFPATDFDVVLPATGTFFVKKLSTPIITAKADEDTTIAATRDGILSPLRDLIVSAVRNVIVNLASARTLFIKDSGGAELLQIDEGGFFTFNFPSGGAFTIQDSNGDSLDDVSNSGYGNRYISTLGATQVWYDSDRNPILTLTG